MVWKHVDQSFPHRGFNNLIEGVESAANTFGDIPNNADYVSGGLGYERARIRTERSA
jgi:hypothetical protein